MPTINPTTEEVEDAFREQVRDILNLDWSTHDFQILDELRRLKNVDTRVTQLEKQMTTLQKVVGV